MSVLAWFLLLVPTSLPAVPPPQANPLADDEPAPPLGVEGPLGNDVFLPIDVDLEARAARGDELLEAARTARLDPVTRGNADRLLTEAFEAWLDVSRARRTTDAALLWHPAEREPTHRRAALDADTALLSFALELSPEERDAWRAFIAEEAAGALARRGGTAAGLASVEAAYPLSPAAAQAALALTDRAIAAGRLRTAEGWLARANSHASHGEDRSLGVAIASRLAWLDEAGALERGSTPELAAAGLTPLGSAPLVDPTAEFYATRGLAAPGPGRGLRAGGAPLDDGRFLVQTTSRVHVVRANAGGPSVEAVFSPSELLPQRIQRPPDAARADGAPGWPLLPVTDDGDVILVHGRAEVVSAFRTEEIAPNGIVCVTPPPPRSGAAPRPTDRSLPKLRWAVVGELRVDPSGAVQRLTTSTTPPLKSLEIQPGPVVTRDTVVASARTMEGDLAVWLLGFDRATGALRWSRMLAQGADLTAEGSRFRFGRMRRPATQPLAVVGGLVFVGSHLGSAHLVDPLDGRILWSVTYRRRAASDPGWAGSRPVVRDVGGSREVTFAPADSDRLYALRFAPDGRLPLRTGRPTEALFAAMIPIGEGEAVLGPSADGFVLQGRAGRDRAVFHRSRNGAHRSDAVYLGREEAFRSVGLAHGDRAIACSDRGLYLFDLSREMALLDYTWLPDAGTVASTRDTGLGGELFLAGDLLWVVGNQAVWAVRIDG